MSKKVSLINNLIMSFIFALTFSLLGQLLGKGYIEIKGLLVSFVVGYIVGTLVVNFIPIPKFAFFIARKVKVKPHTFLYDLVISMVFSLIFTIIMSFTMSILNVSIIGKAPLIIAIKSTLSRIAIFYLISVTISLIVTKPVIKLSKKICKVDQGIVKDLDDKNDSVQINEDGEENNDMKISSNEIDNNSEQLI